MRRDGKHRSLSVKELALRLPKRAWRTVTWREGSVDRLSSRFARVRVGIFDANAQPLASGDDEEAEATGLEDIQLRSARIGF